MAQAIRMGRRRLLIGLGIGIVVLFIFLNILSGFYVDLLWFREVHFSSVFWTIFRTKVVLGFLFGIVFFILLYANLLIVRRITPPFRVFTPEQEVIERYRVTIEPYIKWILPGFAALIALFVGVGASAQWRNFLMWRNSGGVSFGVQDPIFHRDAGFYVFKLPFLQFVEGWLFSSLVAVAVIVAIAHYLSGGIRTQAPAERVSAQVKVHLSVLLGLIFLVKAWGYFLGKFDLLTSNRGVATGASYTDVHVVQKALFVLMVVAILCAVIFFVNIRFRGWAFPAIAIGLLALTAVVAGGVLPAAIQQFSVKPQELQREEPFIRNNIEFTRTAFNLNPIESTAVTPDLDLSQQAVTENQATIDNIRLWDPVILKQSYDQLQRIRQYYEFQDVDVDRYSLSAQERMVMVSAREVSQGNIPGTGGTWQNKHLVYTHGYGAVASQVNASTTEGLPAFILKDIPPVGDPQLHLTDVGNRVYFGERQRDVPFVVVNSGVRELDYQQDSSQRTAPVYTGQGGIQMGGFFGKLLFAWRFRDVNLLISGLIHNDSRIMIFRDINERIPKPAPFLQYDGDPYSAIVDGRIVWIQDAYTSTNRYPYSEPVNLGNLTKGALSGQVNYIRNSVKVVVDAYDGSIKYYVADDTDPIIQVWQRAFPDLFTPFSEAPESLRAHFRYPEDLFTVQAQQFARYHVTQPRVFYGNQDFWSVPEDPNPSAGGAPLQPYYVLTALPGQPVETFSLILPFTPSERNNMVAWMAADSDPANYGKLVSFEFPSGENVDGPLQVFTRINNDPDFSAQRTLLGQGGSNVLFGNFLVIPIGTGFLYVQPVFVQSQQAGTFAELKRVVVVHGGTVGVGNTLAQALTASFQGQPTEPNGPATGTVAERIQQLLAEAFDHFKKADAALKAGDLGTYQKEVQLAQDLIKQANALAAKLTPGATPTPTGSPTSTPSPTPTK
jgi:uncharacterized membrane protein (UPF0182 family)